MATTGVINTKLIKMKIAATGGTPVAVTCQTDASLTVTNGTRQTTCKDSNQWEENLYAMTSYSLSGSAWASEDGANSLSEIIAHATGQVLVDWVLGSGVTGDTKFSGTALITSANWNNPGQNENSEISYELTGTGAIATGTF